MNNQNLKPKYRLLVLMDLSPASYTALRNAVNLAKKLNGSIEVFQVKKTTEVVKDENQVSAIRAIDEERNISKKKLQELINLVSEEENIPIIYDFAFGNVKSEIKNHITKTNPDIVILGKRNQKSVNFLGNGVTQFLLTKHSGAILIAGEDKNILSKGEISLGFYSDTLEDNNLEITKELSKQTKASVKFFSVRGKSPANKEKSTVAQLKSDHNVQNAIEYEFEEGASALDGLAKYISKNSIGVLCVGRGRKKNGWSDRFIGGEPEVNRTIQKLNVPLLIMGDR